MEKKLSLEQLEEIKPICVFDNRVSSEATYTIIIPTFKRPSLLQYAIKSALEQTEFEAYDIIVMDNNPERNDETELFMVQFSKTEHLAYYKEPYKIGGTGNWNKATQMAETEWVVMLHDDDMLYPDFFQILERARHNKPFADAIYSECQHHKFSDGELLPRKSNKPKMWHLKEWDFLLGNTAGPLVGMAYKKLAWQRLGGFDFDYSPMGDYFFHSSLAHYGKIYKIKNYPTTCYRWFDNDTTRPGVAEAMIRQSYNVKLFIMESLDLLMPRCWQQKLCSIAAYNMSDSWQLPTGEYHKPSKFENFLSTTWIRFVRLPMKYRRDILSTKI